MWISQQDIFQQISDIRLVFIKEKQLSTFHSDCELLELAGFAYIQYTSPRIKTTQEGYTTQTHRESSWPHLCNPLLHENFDSPLTTSRCDLAATCLNALRMLHFICMLLYLIVSGDECNPQNAGGNIDRWLNLWWKRFNQKPFENWKKDVCI